MNETMVYADGFEKTFATAEEMLDFLSRRGKASEWIRKPIRALRLVPLEKEAGNLENGDEEMEEILKDTEKHTRLVLKVRGEAYPVRNCAIQTDVYKRQELKQLSSRRKRKKHRFPK